MIVVIGFIEKQDQLLITQRALDTHFGGFWELPGGKLEVGEKPAEALIREFKEELGLDIDAANLICKITQGPIEFYLYHVVNYQNEPQLLAGQMDMSWVKRHELQDKNFPPSNRLFFEIWENYKRDMPN